MTQQSRFFFGWRGWGGGGRSDRGRRLLVQWPPLRKQQQYAGRKITEKTKYMDITRADMDIPRAEMDIPRV